MPVWGWRPKATSASTLTGGTREDCASTASSRARSRAEREPVSRPFTSTRPDAGRSKPLASFTSVDLPQPLGPMMLVTDPDSMRAESPSMKGAPGL